MFMNSSSVLRRTTLAACVRFVTVRLYVAFVYLLCNVVVPTFAQSDASLGGIGAELEATNGVIRLKRIIAASPAERAGLKVGWEIPRINGISTVGMSVKDAVKLVRGDIGTELKLEVRTPDGTNRQISLIREKAQVVGPEWVVSTVPKPGPQGWVTLFDGEKVYGAANPTNANFLAGNVFLKNGNLVMDLAGDYKPGVRFKWQGTNVAVRVRVRKVSGQHVGIGFGGYSAWLGVEACGIGQNIRGKFNDLKVAKLSQPIEDFFDMEFQLIGDDLKLLVNGTVKVQVKAPWVDELRTFEVGPFKGVALYKKIEAREIR